jgi:hypothetical protein
MIATRFPEKIIVKLTLAEAQEVLAIDLDDDKQEALRFIKEKMATKVSLSWESSLRLPGSNCGPGNCKNRCQAVCCVSGRHRSLNQDCNE